MCTPPAGYFKRPSLGILFSALSKLKNEYVGVEVVLLYQRRGDVSNLNIFTQRPLSISKTRTKLNGVCVGRPADSVRPTNQVQRLVSFTLRRTRTYTGSFEMNNFISLNS